MINGAIEGATRQLVGPDGSNVRPLLIKDVAGCMVSAWHPTPAELEAINAGAPILLWISGALHPPVAVSVGEPTT